MSESTENYLETILLLSRKLEYVRSIDIVNETGFSKPSISTAVKKLKAQNLVIVNSTGAIQLTESGKLQAEKVLERHQTLTKALLMLGVPQAIAEEDACRIEHALSDVTFECIKQHLHGKI